MLPHLSKSRYYCTLLYVHDSNTKLQQLTRLLFLPLAELNGAGDRSVADASANKKGAGRLAGWQEEEN